ncbi:hypothetical protein EGH21_19375 [Halomicroarcula sp. F13]|uniref:Uncharacterized protein n=1 Tax=Haloarcula rubra TaxID=2487747 RepID=A0AAW4PX97_9EURY|nr:hypothetical protein [Halomicroarcula rubra]MBX0325190.1 hypothetical protein [Halomicroarcula rubra]
MRSDTVQALQTFLAEERPVEEEMVPAELDGSYCEKLVQPPSTCVIDGCVNEARVLEEDGQFLVRCYANSEHVEYVDKNDRQRYRPDFEAVLNDVAANLSLTPVDYTGDALPRYALVRTEENIDIAVLYGPNDYKKTIKDVLQRTIENGEPCLLLTPRGEISDIVELQSVYGTGYLAYAMPFQQVASTTQIQETLQTIVELHALNQQVITDRFGEDPNDFTVKADRNPSYILSELSQLKILRSNGEIRNGDGSRLEKISEAAFSHLFSVQPGFGGEDSVGEIEPDNLFYIQEDGSHGMIEYEPVLGVVDTKSGKVANFGQEKVDGKHEEYVKRARSYSFQSAAIAHIFVVANVRGKQEIKFYDRMQRHYDEDMYMVVLTVDAFLAIMAAYLSATLSNELSLDGGSFTRGVYPLFHRDTFNSAEYQYLREYTRSVGRSEEEQSEYEQDYDERSSLLVVTRDVVIAHLEQRIEGTGEIERLLETYLE